jgi:hypothetical protein
MAKQKLPMKPMRRFAEGGIVGMTVLDPNGTNYDLLNAEKTQRWAAEDAAKKAQPGIQAPAPTISATPTGPAPGSLASMAVQQPVETTWQQDMDARQKRITGYADKLKGMEQAGRANSLMGSGSSISPGFADGGKIDAEELMARMTAKYGAPAAGPADPAPAPQAGPMTRAVQPLIQTQTQPATVDRPQGIVGLMKSRGAQIDRAVNGYSRGGLVAYARGGKISGPGTPTSDSIPAVVEETGEPIRVANQERILSKDQDSFLSAIAKRAGFDSLDTFLMAGTGKPVGPTIKAGKPAAANGMSIDESDAATYRPDINATTWNSKGFDPQAENLAPGTGAIAITSGQNAGKNIAVGPQNYTAADGTPTSDWSKTAQFAQGTAQAQKDRETLATMQRDRLERDAFDPSIADPNVQANARGQIAEQDTKAGKVGEAQGRMLDNQIKTQRLTSEYLADGLQRAYLKEQDPARRNEIAARINVLQGKGAPQQTLQHVETDNGIMVFDPRTGTMTPAAGPGGAPIKGSKPLTEFQGKSNAFGMRADNSSRIIDQVGKNGEVQPSLLKRAVEDVPLIGGGLGLAANKLQSPEQQQVEQAQRDFVNALLRQESGAAISQSEFNNAKLQYFPQPGDSNEVIAQKRANRNIAINGFRVSAGPAVKNIGGATPQAQPSAGPQVGTVDGKHVFLGGNPADPASWAEAR